MRPTCLSASVALLAMFALPGRASAFIYGSGDTVTHVADLPANSPARQPGKIVLGGNPTKVGFKYYEFHILWMPVWTSTSEGEFVAYHVTGLTGTWGVPLGADPQEVSRQTGVPVSDLKIPWSARNPWGLYLLLALFGVGCAVNAVRDYVLRHPRPGEVIIPPQSPPQQG